MQGFYDRKGHYWKDVEDALLLAACAPAGSDRQHISARFTRHFALLCMPPPPAAAITAILTAVLSDFLAATPQAVAGMGPALVAASVALYERLSAELLPTPAKSHYTFNLRDLSSLFKVPAWSIASLLLIHAPSPATRRGVSSINPPPGHPHGHASPLDAPGGFGAPVGA